MNKNSCRRICVAAFILVLSCLLFSQPYLARMSVVPPPPDTSKQLTIPEGQAQQQTTLVEVVETGDPEDEDETMVVDEEVVRNLLKESNASSAFPTNKRRFKNAKQFAETMLNYTLKYARHEPPISRRGNPVQIRKISSLYFSPTENLPFCAMGVAYVACQAYSDLGPEPISYNPRNPTGTFKNVLPLIKKYYFEPSPSCYYMQRAAMRRLPSQRGSWVWRRDVSQGKRQLKRAWLVLFDWYKKGVRDGVPDHVGIVIGLDPRDADKLITVEFNTKVWRGKQLFRNSVGKKVRSMSRDVLGFIKTY